MDAAAKLGATTVGYGSAPEIARARVRHKARFDIAPASAAAAARPNELRTGTAASEKPHSAHAQRSAARNALLDAQALATPAIERMPAALRVRAAHLPSKSGSNFDTAAETALNRLRDGRPERRPPSAGPSSGAEAQKAATAYQQTLEISG
jgi:hypothetical protein